MNGILKYVRTDRGFVLCPSDDKVFQHAAAVEGVLKNGNVARSAGICILDVKDGKLRCEVMGDSFSLRDGAGASLKHDPEDAERILNWLLLPGSR